MEWEKIDDYHQRCRVYGGWLVKAYEDFCHLNGVIPCSSIGWNFRMSMCFVPDPNGEWLLERDD